MFKFLRKYSVWILGVGGTLLLIAFLAPQVITQLAQQAGYAGTTQATVGDGESVGFEEWQQITREAQVIDQLYTQLPGIGELESPSHWYLLTREADLAGLTPASNAIGIDPQLVVAAAARAGVPPYIVIDAMAHLQGVQRLAQMYQTAGRFSNHRLNHAANKLLSSVAVETVIIPAKPKNSVAFSEKEIQAQFDAWADIAPGNGDHGFGYLLPNRFKVEWVIISKDNIRAAAKQSNDFSSKEQRKYWRRNENDPRFPSIEIGTAIPSEVTEAYLDELEDSTRNKITRIASEKLRAPRRGLESLNGFLILPENWEDESLGFQSLTESLQVECGLSLPTYGSLANFTETTEAGFLPKIGSINVTNLGDTSKRFAQLIQSAKEFGGDGTIPIQEKVASPILETTDGDLFIFRITDASPAHKANTINEVLTQVKYDLGRIAEWEKLQAETSAIEKGARDEGLLAVALQHQTTVNKPQSVSLVEAGIPSLIDPTSRRSLMSQAIMSRIGIGLQINEMATIIQGLQQKDQNIIETIQNHANKLPIEIPISELPPEECIFIVPSEENMALVVIRITGTTPASQELATELSGGQSNVLQTLLSFDELGGANSVMNAFSFEALAERHQFRRGNPEEKEESLN